MTSALPLHTSQAQAAGERPLRIALVVETYARDMGYISSTLPKYLARAGHEVHVVTTELAPYAQIGAAADVFGKEFAARNKNVPGSREQLDGYTVHTLPSRKRFGYAQPAGLTQRLREIRPELVCIFQAAGWIPLQCAWLSRSVGFRLVIGSHMGKTVFPLADAERMPLTQRLRSLLLRQLPGWYIGMRAHHCVVPTQDCAEVATRFFGVQARNVRVMNLPVDTDYFHPVRSPSDEADRERLRASMGFDADEVVFVYSGKFTADKNAVVLLHAVQQLRAQGLKVHALFTGSGEQAPLLAGKAHATVLPFMPTRALGDYYRAADVGVWMNESISFLDGAASGLPLLLGSTVKDLSHVREFTSVFEANNAQALADAAHPLLDTARRHELGSTAAVLAHQRFSATRYALARASSYREALSA